MSEQIKFRNKKTRHLYNVMAIAIDCTDEGTNERAGTQVVVYHPVGDKNQAFVRDESEFREKFEVVIEEAL